LRAAWNRTPHRQARRAGTAKPADKPFETTSNDEQQVGLNLN